MSTPKSLLSLACAVALVSVLVPRTSLANEIMTDRCSAEVAFTDYYAGLPSDGTVVLKRDASGWTNWTPPFRVGLSDAGHIRWWCHSTTGNMFDIGTWRIEEAHLGTECQMNPDGSLTNCEPDRDISIGTSAWEGWTPERSRCDSRTDLIRARLGPDRLLEIECL